VGAMEAAPVADSAEAVTAVAAAVGWVVVESAEGLEE